MNHRHLIAAFIAVVIALPALAAEPAADPYTAAATFKFGDDLKPLATIEAQIRGADAAQRKQIEANLLTLVAAPNATREARDWALRQLRAVATERSVKPLAALLADKDLAALARGVLEGIDGADATNALVAALATAPDPLKPGLAQSLGRRADPRAVPALQPLLAAKDLALARAALDALGHIADAAALSALRAAKVDASLARDRANAILLCADRATATDRKDAAAIYQSVLDDQAADDDSPLRAAALRGLLAADRDRAAAAVANVLKGPDAQLQVVAIRLLADAGAPEALARVFADLNSYAPATQASVFALVNDKSILPAARKALASDDPNLRAAATSAIGRLGAAADIDPLLAALRADADVPAVAAALSTLRDPATDDALTRQLAAAPPDLHTRALATALAQRGVRKSAPDLLRILATTKDGTTARAAGRALATLADAGAIAALVELFHTATSHARPAIAEAIGALAAQHDAREPAAAALIAALPKSTPELKAEILSLLGRLAGDKPLAAVRAALDDPDTTTRDAAVRTLADWPDDAAAPDLLKLASAKSGARSTLALRGYIRLAGKPARSRKPAETLDMFTLAAALVGRPEEQRLLLASLASAPATPELLNLALPHLDTPAVRTEAAQSALKLAGAIASRKPELARTTAQRVKAINITASLTRDADDLLARIAAK